MCQAEGKRGCAEALGHGRDVRKGRQEQEEWCRWGILSISHYTKPTSSKVTSSESSAETVIPHGEAGGIVELETAPRTTYPRKREP
jgi:hypothetical protein